jgi:hypothetical protein
MKSRAKSRSSGLFPHTRARGNTNQFGGAAGNSTGNTKPGPSDDGYKLGMLTERESPPAGGQKIMSKLASRPEPDARNMAGSGGLAWDSSMASIDIGGDRPMKRGRS